jgi:DNA-damage-inducible protein D
LAKTYFAIQTRKQEMQDQYMEDNKRLYLREEMKTHNKKLMSTAKEA